MNARSGRLARFNGGPKPRVLLVDDQPPVLEAVSAMLAGDFDVVGTATDGRQALDTARRVHPDAIVLDIEMPGLDGIAAYFDRALRRGDATCVIAPARVRDGLGNRLQIRGWNVGGSPGHPRYLAVDAAEALDRFMRNGLPDRGRLAEIVEELDQYRLAVAEGSMSSLTIFGNMAELLCAAGNVAAVIALRRLWDTLTRERRFVTVCAYGTSCFDDSVPDLLPVVCAEHSLLSHASDL